MESLIIPVVLLMAVGLWGAFESGRKFRREFRQRGKQWKEACADVARGEGILVVDTVWGPQRGLGHPAIWWIQEEAFAGADLTPHIETGGRARLVKCPGNMRNLTALRQQFGAERVVAHSWSAAGALVDTRQ